MLIVVHDRDLHALAQGLLDDEAFRRLDVLEIDAAEAGLQQRHRVDEALRVLGVELEVDGVDVGEALEQHRLAFHHRLGGERAEIAQAENGGAVGDDGDEIALGGIVIGGRRVLGDDADRHGDARRISQRQVALASPSAWKGRSRSCPAGRPNEKAALRARKTRYSCRRTFPGSSPGQDRPSGNRGRFTRGRRGGEPHPHPRSFRAEVRACREPESRKPGQRRVPRQLSRLRSTAARTERCVLGSRRLPPLRLPC